MRKQCAVMIFKCGVFFHCSRHHQHKQEGLSSLHWISLCKRQGQKVRDTDNVLFSESHIFCGSLTPPLAMQFPALSRGPVWWETPREGHRAGQSAEPHVLMQPMKCCLLCGPSQLRTHRWLMGGASKCVLHFRGSPHAHRSTRTSPDITSPPEWSRSREAPFMVFQSPAHCAEISCEGCHLQHFLPLIPEVPTQPIQMNRQKNKQQKSHQEEAGRTLQ